MDAWTLGDLCFGSMNECIEGPLSTMGRNNDGDCNNIKTSFIPTGENVTALL